MTEKRIPQYRIYIDESGDHTYSNLDNPAERYLGLIGCIIENEYYRTEFHPKFEKIKQKHFPHNPDHPVIFHRSDIVSKRGPFWRLRDPSNLKAFNEDLLKFIDEQEFVIITVVIDKKKHIETYGEAAYHPYHYCLAAMMERYCGLLNYSGKVGDVMAESRSRQDRPLKKAYRNLYFDGTLFRRAKFFQQGLTSNEIKLKRKEANIAGLQIADLLAHPCREEILIERGLIKDSRGEFTKTFRTQLEKKYNRHLYKGTIYGYGKVFLG